MIEELKFELSDECPKDWDSSVLNNNGFFYGTSLYALSYKKFEIGQGRYLSVYNDKVLICRILLVDCLIGGIQLLKYLPKWFLKFLRNFSFLQTFFFHLSFTEFINFNEQEKKNVIKEVIDFIFLLAEKENKNVGAGDIICFDNENTVDELMNLLENKFFIKKTATSRLVLSRTKEDLLNNLSVKRRNDVNYAMKNGVIVKRFEGSRAVDFFYKALKISMKKYDLLVPPKKYYIELLKNKFIKYYLVYHNNNLVCGSGAIIFGNNCLEFSMFSTDYEKVNNTRGGDLLKYEIMKDCLDSGVYIYDFNMVDVSNINKGINFFKEKWGGKRVFGIFLFKRNRQINFIKKIIHLGRS